MRNKYIGVNKYQLDTPALVIDKNKLINNIVQMQKFALSKNVAVRPHAKTHKCSIICKLQLEHEAIGICVAKVSEAYELAKAGIKSILITSPIVTSIKINTLLEVLRLSPDTILVVDNLDNAVELNEVMKANMLTLDILLDIESGIARTGVMLENALEIARSLNNLSNLNFKGIQCYAGQLQHIVGLSARNTASTDILVKVGKIKQQLCSEGIDCQIQTGSGTGTFEVDAEIETVTEIQPGSYTVMDQEYNGIEYKTCKFDTAMTLLTSVISANATSHVTVDAGTKTLYQVETPPKVISHNGLNYAWGGFGDEHGKITANNDVPLPKLGEVLELVVAHCDPTINLFDYFYITENDIVVDCWKIDLRGKSQ